MTDPGTKHERRVVGHASGWKEQMDTCACGKPWPCSELQSSKEQLIARLSVFIAASDTDEKVSKFPVATLLRDVRQYLQSPVETSGWRPMDTAPKSRSDAGKDREYVLVVYPGWKDGKPDPFVITAFQDSLGWDTGVWRLHEEPTHWMPLPRPPGSPEEPAGALPPAFQSLLDLKPNWDSYGAKRINPACVQKAYEIWQQLAGTWLPVPHSDGTVGLEQHQGGFDIEIDVDLALPPEKASDE